MEISINSHYQKIIHSEFKNKPDKIINALQDHIISIENYHPVDASEQFKKEKIISEFGLSLAKKKETEKALRYINLALELIENKSTHALSESLLLARGKLYYKQKNYESALIDYKTLYKKRPDNRKYIRLVERILNRKIERWINVIMVLFFGSMLIDRFFLNESIDSPINITIWIIMLVSIASVLLLNNYRKDASES